MEDPVRGIWLISLNFPHYYLREDGWIYNACTDTWRIPQKPNEYVLWDINHTQRYRINSNHLISWMFESPEAVCKGMYTNLWFLGYSRYDLTMTGRVYSRITYRYMVGNISFDGYYRVCLVDDYGHQRTEVISRLVALAFISNPENKPEVNHIDGDKSNNDITNLEWTWGWENVHHALVHGLRKSALSDKQIHEICRRLERGDTVKSIMEAMDLPKHAILGIKSGCHARISKLYNIPRNKHF